MTRVVPLPVRLTNMQEVEERYLAANADGRLAQHGELAFYNELTIGERAALERRYPNELAGDPEKPGAPEGMRVAWDFRCRELVVCMLRFGDQLLRGRMDLVGSVGVDEDVAVLALTVTGSVVALARPDSDGARRFVYRPSPRPERGLKHGKVPLSGPIRLGDRMKLGDLGTTEVLVLAAGPEEPAEQGDTALPLFLSPDVDTGPEGATSDGFRLAMTRFRVLVDASVDVVDADRARVHERVMALAAEIQQMCGPGVPLARVRSLSSATRSTYEIVAVHDEGVEVVRRPRGVVGPDVSLAKVRIGPQSVVVGAPLVLQHTDADGSHGIVAIFNVSDVEI